MMKNMYKLRDGPIDWYFCDAEHALDWLEHRHASLAINTVLRMLPQERQKHMQGKTIEEHIKSIK